MSLLAHMEFTVYQNQFEICKKFRVLAMKGMFNLKLKKHSRA